MKNFNRIFELVQEQCQGQKAIDSEESLLKIAASAGVSIDRLHFYLDCLQEIGLIHYDQKRKKVSLTGKGERAKYVFPNK